MISRCVSFDHFFWSELIFTANCTEAIFMVLRYRTFSRPKVVVQNWDVDNPAGDRPQPQRLKNLLAEDLRQAVGTDRISVNDHP
jgi:hypothetical protein